ncbi:MAG: protoporphyrinogen oxidase [Candidatus Cyclobacteriaceae bacterium M3_2C_046]
MGNKNPKIVIVGAGISGLATAFWLKKAGHDVTILEASTQAGGTIITQKNDDYIMDFGPNSGLETSPAIRELVDSIGLKDQMVYADQIANKRYILKNDQLLPLPTSPGQFVKSRLFTTKAKIRLMAEPLVGRSKEGYYQSIADFVKRRIGQEFLDYAVNPFVAGIYAGDPKQLSVQSALPRLYRLEEKYGGLIKGMIRGARERKKDPEASKQTAKMFSFKQGMQQLPEAIATQLKDQIKFAHEVKSIENSGSGYQLQVQHKKSMLKVQADKVLFTIPAYKAKTVFKAFDQVLAQHLAEIYYPPVAVIFAVYPKKAIRQPLDGFGFLIPEKEQKKFLGAIWSSVIFPERINPRQSAFTLFVGGARDSQIFTMKENIMVDQVLLEFEQIMKINAPPAFFKMKKWRKAIPQYNLGYIEHEKYFDQMEKVHPGLFLSGNYRGGVSLGDCIKNAKSIALKMQQQVDSRPKDETMTPS